MSQCARPGCCKLGLNKCSTCLRVPYCSADCQKMDWKLHKLICKTLKKLSHPLQPYQDVARIIQEINPDLGKLKNRHLEATVLKYLIAYAEHQFGDRVERLAYRERENGNRMNNWKVEIDILLPIYETLIDAYAKDESLSVIVRDDLKFPYYEKMLNLLRPWSEYVKLKSTSLRDSSLAGDQINHILRLSSSTECMTAIVHLHRNLFDRAASYFQRGLCYARMYEGGEEENTNLLCKALRVYDNLQSMQGNLAAAVASAEEAYNYVAVTYNPVHPEVQRAAGTLIECLCRKGDLYNAERFAEATLDSLKDPANEMDQQSKGVARGCYNLADVINRQKGDLVKAEMLARESLRIRTRIFHNDDSFVGMSTGLLGKILLSQEKLGYETKELYERSLNIYTKSDGLEGINTAAANVTLGIFYHQLAESQQTAETRREHLYLPQSKY